MCQLGDKEGVRRCFQSPKLFYLLQKRMRESYDGDLHKYWHFLDDDAELLLQGYLQRYQPCVRWGNCESDFLGFWDVHAWISRIFFGHLCPLALLLFFVPYLLLFFYGSCSPSLVLDLRLPSSLSSSVLYPGCLSLFSLSLFLALFLALFLFVFSLYLSFSFYLSVPGFQQSDFLSLHTPPEDPNS